MNVSRVGRSYATWVGLSFVLALSACGDPKSAPTPSVGSNSNWLKACDSNADCNDEHACRCGTCTLECASDLACAGLPNARCAAGGDLALMSTCGMTLELETPAGLCLPRCEPGSCGDGAVCIDGACVPAQAPQPPEPMLCDSAPEPPAEQRELEDQLLALVLDERMNGGFQCGDDSAPGSALPLRVDARLTCAARTLAQDMDEAGIAAVVEGDGRATVERFRAAGYDAQLWGVNFAVRARGPGDALRLMHNDLDTCRRFADARFRDIGVGNVRDTYIVTLAVSE